MGFQGSINRMIGTISAVGAAYEKGLKLIEKQQDAAERVLSIQEAKKIQKENFKKLSEHLRKEYKIQSSYANNELIIPGRRGRGRPRKESIGKLKPNDLVIKND